LRNKTNTAEAGATPKLTTSANESSSLPRGEDTPKRRAEKPSKKSNTAAINTQITTPKKFSEKAIVRAMHPEKRFIMVNALGICFFIFKINLRDNFQFTPVSIHTRKK
jgi:hypothetical protein